MNIKGTIQKLPNGRFRLFEENKDRTFKVSQKELRKIFPGDKVICSLTSRGWAVIDKVIERNTTEFLGRIHKSNRNYQAIPFGLDKNFLTVIKGKVPNSITRNSIVKIRITVQPQQNSQARGFIVKTLDGNKEEVMANEVAISTYNINSEWTKPVVKEARSIQKRFKEKLENQFDLTEKNFVTIDGQNAKDFDDAVYAEKDQDNNFVLYVAIANVSNFIDEGSFIDQEARKRGTSVYFVNKVIPMLPEIISNDLCSLKPNETRSCLICKIRLNNKGSILEASFFEGLISSKARLIYERVSKNFEENLFHGDQADCLRILNEIYELLRRVKVERGALDIEIPEFFPKFTGGKIEKFVSLSRDKAHKVIEECMLLANICAAKITQENNIPSLYRIHPKPEKSKLKNLSGFLRSRGINTKMNSGIHPKELSTILSRNLSRKEKGILHQQILQTMSLASYSNKSSSHFGLAYEAYTHFTSPIRRYPDLMVHRIIRKLIKKSGKKEIFLKNEKEKRNNKIKKDKLMEKIAAESSFAERNAEEATRKAIKIIKCECAKKHIGKSFNGTIVNVTAFGIFVLLSELNIEGLCHIKNLPGKDFYDYEEVSKSLIGRFSKTIFSLGDSVRVKIYASNSELQRIDLKLCN